MGVLKVEAYLSGGAANSDPDLSLGGVISTTKLSSQTPVYDTTTISGVTLVDSTNIDSIELTFSLNTGSHLSIRKTTDTTPIIEVDVSVDGFYILESPTGEETLTVSIIAASLPVTNETVTVTSLVVMHNLLDTVPANESEVGGVNYRHLYFTNISGAAIQLAVFIKAQLNGFDYLEIGFENTDSGFVDQQLGSEIIAPSGVTFNSPTDFASAIELSLTAGSSIGMFIKRTVPPLTNIDTPVDTAILEISEFT